jgi:hypothetical protein
MGSFRLLCVLQEISGSFRLLSQNAGRTQHVSADLPGGPGAKHSVMARQSDSSVEESTDEPDVAPTPGGCCRTTALLYNLRVAQLANKYPAFCGTRGIFSAFTSLPLDPILNDCYSRSILILFTLRLSGSYFRLAWSWFWLLGLSSWSNAWSDWPDDRCPRDSAQHAFWKRCKVAKQFCYAAGAVNHAVDGTGGCDGGCNWGLPEPYIRNWMPLSLNCNRAV